MEPELKPLEPVELEFELEPEDVEPDEPEPDEFEFDEFELDEPEFDDPELDVPDEPVLAEEEPDDAEEDELALWVEPGRARATTPAAATLAKVTVVVVERTLARPCSLAAMARWIASRCALLM